MNSRLDVGAFTAADIQTMARFAGVPVDVARRLVECAVTIGKLPAAEPRSDAVSRKHDNHDGCSPYDPEHVAAKAGDAVTAQPNPSDSASPDEPSRFVEQRFDNDCWNACVASLFSLPYEAVADLPRGDGSDPTWRKAWTDWFRERGYVWWVRPLGPDGRYYGFGELAIVCGKSPRTEGGHCVLFRNGEIVWDPHPQREMGLSPLTSVVYLIAADPSEARAASASVPLLDANRLRTAWANHREKQHGSLDNDGCSSGCAADLARAYAAETPEQGRGDE